MFYFLTSSSSPIRLDIRSTSVRAGDPVYQSKLSLNLKAKVGTESFAQQQIFLDHATNAAFNSLTKIDQRNRFRLSIDYQQTIDDAINLADGSSSSGLAYAIAVYHSISVNTLKKRLKLENPIFCSGQIDNDGSVSEVGFIEDKIEGLLNYLQKSEITKYMLCLPSSNEKDISAKLNEQITQSGGVIFFGDTLVEVLFKIYGADFDGDSFGRWKPFKGLESFEYEDSLRFFGRTQDIQRLYDDINYNKGILIVSGPSGSGKSSLIKAGLIPLLTQQNLSFFWDAITPSALASSIIDTFLDSITTQTGATDTDLKKLNSGLQADSHEAYASLSKILEEKTFLFYIDQFEEFFTQNTAGRNIEDIAVLRRISSKVPQVKIVFAIRNEYISVLLDTGIISSPVISNVSENLSSQSWHEIVNEQAAFSNIEFDKEPKDLAQVIVDDAINTPSALPVVSYILAQLYECAVNESNSKVCLRYEDYKRLGGLKGVIAKRAEAAIQLANVSEKEIHLFFSVFIGVNNDGIYHAKEISLNGDNIPESLIFQLTTHNILKHNSVNDSYKLAHESLLLSWDRLKDWIKTQESFLVWLNRIDFEFKTYKKDEQKSHLIHNHDLLNEGMVFIENGTLINSSLVNYVNSSKKEQFKKRRNSFIKFVVLPIALIGLFWFDKESTRDEYYANYGLKYGVPFGVGKLNAEQKKFKQFRYRLTYQGGLIAKFLGYGSKLLEMAHENSLGYTFTTDFQNFEAKALWEYEYNENGKIENINIFNQAGSFIERQNFIFNKNGASVYTVNSDNNYIASSFNTKNSFSNPFQMDSVVRKDITFDKDGLHIVEKYKRNGFGDNAQDLGGINERRFSFNELGLKEYEKAVADIETNEPSLFTIKFKYNDIGLVVQEDYSELEPQLYMQQSFSYVNYSYDKVGNLKSVIYLDNNKEKANNFENISSQFISLSPNGWIERVEELDSKGNPTNANNVLGFDVTYDAYGYPKEVAFFDMNRDNAVHPDGYSKVQLKFNSQGFRTSELYFDQASNLTPAIEGLYSGVIFKRNDTEKLVHRKEYIDLSGEMVVGEGKFSFEELTYNADTNTDTWSFYDSLGDLIENPFNGCAQIKIVKNSKNLITKRSCHDAHGNVIDAYDFPAITLNKYDDNNYLIEKMFMDQFGNIAEHPDLGYAIKKSEFDANGRELLIYMVGADKKPLLDIKNGIAGVKTDYDTTENTITRLYIDAGFNPMIHPSENVAGYKTTFDTNDKNTQQVYLGIDKKPLIHPDKGVAGYEWETDEKGKITFSIALNSNLLPMIDPEFGTAGFKASYDSKGNVESFINLNTNLLPMKNEFGRFGYEQKFNEKQQLISFINLGSTGEPEINPIFGFAGEIYGYDQFGNKNFMQFIDKEGIPMIDPSTGVSGWRAKYDSNGYKIRHVFIGLNGEPSRLKSSTNAGWKSTYDSRGNEVRRIFFDEDLEPVQLTEGYASWKQEFDSEDNVISIEFYDINGKLLQKN